MFHEQPAFGGPRLPNSPIVFAGNVIFNAERCRYVNGCAEPVPSRTTARRVLRTNDTLLHRITRSAGDPFSSFGSLAPPKKLVRSGLFLSLEIDEGL